MKQNIKGKEGEGQKRINGGKGRKQRKEEEMRDGERQGKENARKGTGQRERIGFSEGLTSIFSTGCCTSLFLFPFPPFTLWTSLCLMVLICYCPSFPLLLVTSFLSAPCPSFHFSSFPLVPFPFLPFPLFLFPSAFSFPVRSCSCPSRSHFVFHVIDVSFLSSPFLPLLTLPFFKLSLSVIWKTVAT